MRTLETKKVFVIDDKHFDTVKQARDHCENAMEKHINSLFSAADINNLIGIKGHIRLMELLCNDQVRQNLINVLSYDLSMKDDDDE